jgi:hypothetical protein
VVNAELWQRERGLHIYRLSPDYLNVTSSVYLWKEKFESPAILKRGRNYYMFSSHLTGWKPNDNIYSTATSLSGPWSAWKNFAPARSNTYNSQTTYILPVTENLAVYMGDRWVEKDLSRSTYVWLPLRISGTQVSLQNLESWNSPVGQSGAAGRSPDITYHAKSAQLSGGAKFVNNAAGYIGGPSAGVVKFSGIQSGFEQRRTLKIFYSNRDRGTRYAAVMMNGGKAQRVAFLSTENGKGISTVTVQLKAGKNDISIGGLNGGWGPDVDSLKIASPV